ncbi:transporter [Bombiscardovia apis]|uniref:Transporter n=1 Tax=Bombiscardovia apis TaxID=2932182 RepID=A0ABN6SGF3_9BIFI|nr:MFS transporter [Bombiscardovia apis]BDR55061.1 transporter [Bombiscardovia apis]
MLEFKRNPAFRSLLLSNLLNALGGEFFNLVFIVYAQTLPQRQLAVSIASAAWVAPALTSFAMGYLADCTARKTRAQLWVKAVQTCIYLSIAMLIGRLQGFGIFLLLMGLDLVSSVMEGYASSLWMPVLKHLVPASSLREATSLTSAVNSLAAVVSASLGATLLAVLGNDFSLFSLINAATFLVAGLIIAARRREFAKAERAGQDAGIGQFSKSEIRPISAESDSDMPLEMSESVPTKERQQGLVGSWNSVREQFRSSRFLTLTLCFGVFVNMIGGALGPLLSVELVDQTAFWWHSYGSTVAGVTGFGSVGLVAGALLSADPLRKLSMAPLLALTMTCAALAAGSLAWGATPFALFAAVFAMNYLLGKINPRFMALLMETIPEEQLAATMGAIQTAMIVGAPLGQFAFLALANILPGKITLWLYMGCALLLAMVLAVVGHSSMNAVDSTRSVSARSDSTHT